MNGYQRIAIGLSLLCLLCGCAHDKLLRLETQDYVKVAEKTEASGRAFYDGMIESDRALWAELYAIDEKCTPKSLGPSAFSADTNDDGNVDSKDKGFCLSLSDEKDLRISNEIDRDMFQRQYAALAFLRSYLTALATASADPELSAEKEFKAAADDLALLSEALRVKSMLDKNQLEAVGNLIDFMENLSKEHRSAKEIRGIVETEHKNVHAAFDVLIEAMRKDISLKRSTASLKGAIEVFIAQTAPMDDKTMERRKKIIAMHYARIDIEEKEQHRIAACSAIPEKKIEQAIEARDAEAEESARREKSHCEFPEAGAMLAAKQASLDFIDLALEGRMSAKQKARLIKMQRENFMRAVSIFIDVTTAF